MKAIISSALIGILGLVGTTAMGQSARGPQVGAVAANHDSLALVHKNGSAAPKANTTLYEYAFLAAGKGGIQCIMPDGSLKVFEYINPPRGFDPYAPDTYVLNTKVRATFVKVINDFAAEGWVLDKALVSGNLESYYLSRPRKQ